MAEAARLRGVDDSDPAARVVIDLAKYAAAAHHLSRTPMSTTDDPTDIAGNNDDEEMA